ncbi:MAG: hypothetical protein WA655_15300 [Candidatus Korobacteraceae bacterium]
MSGCGGSNNTTNNVGLFGDWNIVMYPTGSSTPSYVFALAISQEGTSYSGSSITYTGGVAAPSNMCINANALSAQATTSGTNFTMTVTDTTTDTVITVNGSLATQSGQLSGTYSNSVTAACQESRGTMAMSPQ